VTGSADRDSRTRNRISREPCSDFATGISGVMPTALQRAESRDLRLARLQRHTTQIDEPGFRAKEV
jgi:hypothetical protein